MSAAENVPKIRIWPRSIASKALVKFEENLLAKDLYQPAYQKPKFSYLITLPLFLDRALTADFVDLLYFPGRH